MAFALVGAAGTASVSAVGAAVTPAWGAGASRTAGNLLLCFVSVTQNAASPGTPSGWSSATSGLGTSCMAAVYYRVATGSDAAPTLNAVSNGIIAVHLEEWSGGDGTPSGQIFPPVSGTTSPLTGTLNTVDDAAGQLLVMVGADRRSAARATVNTWTSNHGTPTLRASNNGVSSADHYSHATLVTNSNSGADTATVTLSITTSITGLIVAAASFRLAAPPATQTATLGLLDAAPGVFAPNITAVVTANPPYVQPYPPLLAQ